MVSHGYGHDPEISGSIYLKPWEAEELVKAINWALVGLTGPSLPYCFAPKTAQKRRWARLGATKGIAFGSLPLIHFAFIIPSLYSQYSRLNTFVQTD